MQISALNLIIAAQQARSAAPPRQAPTAPAARAPTPVAEAKPAEAAGEFAPLAFRTSAAEPTPVPAPPGRLMPPGSKLDIRV